MKLVALGLGTKTLNNLVEMILRNEGDLVGAGLSGKQRLKVYAEQAQVRSVKSVMDAYEGQYEKVANFNAGRSMRLFMSQLSSLGVSTIDWLHMPFSSLRGLYSRKLTKDEWRKEPILALEVFTDWTSASDFHSAFPGFSGVGKISIKRLLNWRRNRAWPVIEGHRVKIRRKLRGLGFRYEDGPFMRQGTREEFERNLMAKHRLSRRQLNAILKIAKAERWDGFEFED